MQYSAISLPLGFRWWMKERWDKATSWGLCFAVYYYYYYYYRFTAFWTVSGTTRVSRYQKGKTNLDLLEQEIVSGSGISWAIRNAYSLRPPARSPPAGDTWVHLIPHSTHSRSSSLHGAVNAGSHSEIEKRALPPPCFPSFSYQSTRSQGATLVLLPPVLT